MRIVRKGFNLTNHEGAQKLLEMAGFDLSFPFPATQTSLRRLRAGDFLAGTMSLDILCAIPEPISDQAYVLETDSDLDPARREDVSSLRLRHPRLCRYQVTRREWPMGALDKGVFIRSNRNARAIFEWCHAQGIPIRGHSGHVNTPIYNGLIGTVPKRNPHNSLTIWDRPNRTRKVGRERPRREVPIQNIVVGDFTAEEAAAFCEYEDMLVCNVDVPMPAVSGRPFTSWSLSERKAELVPYDVRLVEEWIPDAWAP